MRPESNGQAGFLPEVIKMKHYLSVVARQTDEACLPQQTWKRQKPTFQIAKQTSPRIVKKKMKRMPRNLRVKVHQSKGLPQPAG